MKIANSIPQSLFVKYNRDLSRYLNSGEVLFIESIRYFLNNPNLGIIIDGRKWVYNSFENLAKHMNYSTRQLRRIVSSLREKKILLTGKFSRGRYNRTNHYSLNEEKIIELLGLSGDKEKCQNVLSNKDKMSSSITKNTSLDLINKSEKRFTSQTSQNYIKKDIANSNTGSNQPTTGLNQHPDPNKNQKILNTTVQDMFKIWKERFPKASDCLNKDISMMMVAAFKTKFGSNLNKWRHYLKQIESSDYLMSETFNLKLSWVLKYKTIDRIKNNELGVKDTMYILTAEEIDFEAAEATQAIESTSDTPLVKSVRREAMQLFGAHTYKSWFEQLEMFETNDGVSYKTPNKFIHDYVRDNYWHKLSNVNLKNNIHYKLSA